MKIRSILAVAAIGAVLSGCAGQGYGDKQTGGAVIGGVLGGLLGSQIGGGSGKLAATAGGAILGLIIGSETGRSLDKADHLYASRSTHTVLETNRSGQTSVWTSDKRPGVYVSTTPAAAYLDPRSNRYCREYQQEITIGGKTKQAYGTACRQPDGSWEIVSVQQPPQVVIQRRVVQPQTVIIHRGGYPRRRGFYHPGAKYGSGDWRQHHHRRGKHHRRW